MKGNYFQQLSWPQLNVELAKCENEAVLSAALAAACLDDEPLYRRLRIYGRFSAVRRERELAELRRRAE